MLRFVSGDLLFSFKSALGGHEFRLEKLRGAFGDLLAGAHGTRI
jgi:hypothetical protein